MKTRLIVILSLFLISLIVSTPAIAEKDPFADAGFTQVRKQIVALDFTLEDLEQNYIKLSDYRGKTVLLFFWTTW
jgi:cytochrome oxidase Cu insertion factor (SCO1/SenC/PrrC family)